MDSFNPEKPIDRPSRGNRKSTDETWKNKRSSSGVAPELPSPVATKEGGIKDERSCVNVTHAGHLRVVSVTTGIFVDALINTYTSYVKLAKEWLNK